MQQRLPTKIRSQIEAQRSGFDLERRSKGAGGWWAQPAEAERTLLRRRTRLELATAHPTNGLGPFAGAPDDLRIRKAPCGAGGGSEFSYA